MQRSLEKTGINLDREWVLQNSLNFCNILYTESSYFEAGIVKTYCSMDRSKHKRELTSFVMRSYVITNVIVSVTGAMAKRYVCKACNKGCYMYVTHKCQQACSGCMSVPPCMNTHVRIQCEA